MMDGELQRQLQTLRLFFDYVRVVDPLHNDILISEENGQFVKEQGRQTCYSIWGCTKPCENCISIQALRTKTIVEKLEYIDREIFLIMARVIEVGRNEHVVEAIRNVTDSSIIEKIENKTREEIQQEIQQLNNRLIKDEMLGCYTRMYLDNRLPVLIAQQCDPKTEPIIVSFFDLDNFKQINDQYGHQVGDQLLRAIGHNLQKHILQEHFWMARVGGDEFVCVIENQSPQEAAKLLQAAKESIEQTQVSVDSTTYVHAHVSYGSAIVEAGDTAMTVLERADQAMYAQKNQKK